LHNSDGEEVTLDVVHKDIIRLDERTELVAGVDLKGKNQEDLKKELKEIIPQLVAAGVFEKDPNPPAEALTTQENAGSFLKENPKAGPIVEQILDHRIVNVELDGDDITIQTASGKRFVGKHETTLEGKTAILVPSELFLAADRVAEVTGPTVANIGLFADLETPNYYSVEGRVSIEGDLREGGSADFAYYKAPFEQGVLFGDSIVTGNYSAGGQPNAIHLVLGKMPSISLEGVLARPSGMENERLAVYSEVTRSDKGIWRMMFGSDALVDEKTRTKLEQQFKEEVEVEELLSKFSLVDAELVLGENFSKDSVEGASSKTERVVEPSQKRQPGFEIVTKITSKKFKEEDLPKGSKPGVVQVASEKEEKDLSRGSSRRGGVTIDPKITAVEMSPEEAGSLKSLRDAVLSSRPDSNALFWDIPPEPAAAGGEAVNKDGGTPGLRDDLSANSQTQVALGRKDPDAIKLNWDVGLPTTLAQGKEEGGFEPSESLSNHFSLADAEAEINGDFATLPEVSEGSPKVIGHEFKGKPADFEKRVIEAVVKDAASKDLFGAMLANMEGKDGNQEFLLTALNTGLRRDGLMGGVYVVDKGGKVVYNDAVQDSQIVYNPQTGMMRLEKDVEKKVSKVFEIESLQLEGFKSQDVDVELARAGLAGELELDLEGLVTSLDSVESQESSLEVAENPEESFVKEEPLPGLRQDLSEADKKAGAEWLEWFDGFQKARRVPRGTENLEPQVATPPTTPAPSEETEKPAATIMVKVLKKEEPAASPEAGEAVDLSGALASGDYTLSDSSESESPYKMISGRKILTATEIDYQREGRNEDLTIAYKGVLRPTRELDTLQPKYVPDKGVILQDALALVKEEEIKAEEAQERENTPEGVMRMEPTIVDPNAPSPELYASREEIEQAKKKLVEEKDAVDPKYRDIYTTFAFRGDEKGAPIVIDERVNEDGQKVRGEIIDPGSGVMALGMMRGNNVSFSKMYTGEYGQEFIPLQDNELISPEEHNREAYVAKLLYTVKDRQAPGQVSMAGGRLYSAYLNTLGSKTFFEEANAAALRGTTRVDESGQLHFETSAVGSYIQWNPNKFADLLDSGAKSNQERLTVANVVNLNSDRISRFDAPVDEKYVADWNRLAEYVNAVEAVSERGHKTKEQILKALDNWTEADLRVIAVLLDRFPGIADPSERQSERQRKGEQGPMFGPMAAAFYMTEEKEAALEYAAREGIVGVDENGNFV
ncbi:MAG: hypothetical protein NUV91_02090, partial [Candidatus Omnitrophica bacterium]|nr:hypothetical protein [Candidatus Omnitrophota bacterium]